MAKTSRYENKAHRSFWSIHVEAWLQSGVGQEAYCRQHRLSRNTFRRWQKALQKAAAVKLERKKRHRRSRVPHARSARSKALLAFWSMHVEALQWSGLGAQAYARAHGLSVDSLRHWRRQLAVDPPGIDWREMLHPSARPRPKLSVELSSGAKTAAVESVLTSAPAAPPARDGRSNRRSFTDAEKLAIVTEAEQPGASVASVARRHEIATSMIFRWRAQFGFGQDMRARLATVRLQERHGRGRPRRQPAALVLHDVLPVPDGFIAVELADGRRVFAPSESDPEAVRRYVAERETAP
jgi:transposase-like protein